MAVVADRLGCDPAATSTAQLRNYFREMRPELGAGTQARDAARWLLMPPLPLAVRPTYAVITGAAIGLLRAGCDASSGCRWPRGWTRWWCAHQPRCCCGHWTG